MKYICFKIESTGIEEIFLFPRKVHHNCASEALYAIRDQMHDDWKRERRTPVSAGFVSMSAKGIICHGDSESLGLRARDQDSQILCTQLGIECASI